MMTCELACMNKKGWHLFLPSALVPSGGGQASPPSTFLHAQCKGCPIHLHARKHIHTYTHTRTYIGVHTHTHTISYVHTYTEVAQSKLQALKRPPFLPPSKRKTSPASPSLPLSLLCRMRMEGRALCKRGWSCSSRMALLQRRWR